MCINWIKKVGNRAAHNAFVDLCEFKQQLFVCYREAENHLSADGIIRILTLDFQGQILYSSQIAIPKMDLRDPKLTLTPDGQLLLIAFARHTSIQNKTIGTRNLTWLSQTGQSWSTAKEFAARNWWLWRVRWHKDLAYGFAYNKKQNAIDFYSGNPRRSFHLHQPYVLSLHKHQLGYPNESDLIFDNNKAYALVRRDADSYTAQLGLSQFPFKKWRWIDLGRYIGGPTMLRLDENFALVAGRIVKQGRLVTGLLKMNLDNGELQELLILPSAGDNSYPGLVLKNDCLYISYYSSHEDNKSGVYLANINIHLLLQNNNHALDIVK
ncbi:hypothetical protein [uncultured Paraglaciecola sp.]|uniref:hypothetical protein n=1 Tax=uncultured Paraglaciecola sp. TaxID=1765024 RepID=UPI0030D91B15|tara:strand:- start:14764 stop:15735 length:972 start_codon:yes stop_codon:yes gene_type:complete